MTDFIPINVNLFSELYKVNKTGEVYSTLSKIILKPHVRNGYLTVCLYNGKEDVKKNVPIHRIMGLTYFDENVVNDKKYVINHKDGNKLNNNLDNLEVITTKENVQHAHDTKLINVHKKAVLQYDLKGNFIKEYSAIDDAVKELNIKDNHISEVCKGTRKTSNGFIWKYKAEENNNLLDEFNIDEYTQITDFPSYYLNKDGKLYNLKSKKYLKPQLTESGYYKIKLVDGSNSKDYYIHRLVASYFVKNPNPDKYDVVNHKDMNKTNNNADNLEWLDNKSNSIHSKQNLKSGNYKKVKQYDLDGNFIKEYDSAKEAGQENNMDNSGISKCCKNVMKSYRGFIWKFSDETEAKKHLEPVVKPLYNEDGNKKCNKCNKYLALTKFTNESSQCDECKEKDKAYQKEKRAKAKLASIQEN